MSVYTPDNFEETAADSSQSGGEQELLLSVQVTICPKCGQADLHKTRCSKCGERLTFENEVTFIRSQPNQPAKWEPPLESDCLPGPSAVCGCVVCDAGHLHACAIHRIPVPPPTPSEAAIADAKGFVTWLDKQGYLDTQWILTKARRENPDQDWDAVLARARVEITEQVAAIITRRLPAAAVDIEQLARECAEKIAPMFDPWYIDMEKTTAVAASIISSVLAQQDGK